MLKESRRQLCRFGLATFVANPWLAPLIEQYSNSMVRQRLNHLLSKSAVDIPSSGHSPSPEQLPQGDIQMANDKAAQQAKDRQANKESHGKQPNSGQQPAERERNIAHPKGEEHSRRGKG
jgi:hypothetical protein